MVGHDIAYQIVVNTPLWVWPLMLFVLWLGWRGLDRESCRRRGSPSCPWSVLATSLAGIAQSLQPGLALAGWAVALLAAAAAGLGHRFAPGGAACDPKDGRLEVAGGWFVLGFAVSIFVVRYTLGVLSA
jgi:hypothetical protein